MPTNRRRTKPNRRQQVRELGPDLKRHLLYGYFFQEGFQDLQAMRGWWREVRAAVLPAWVKQLPCTRPFAWWLFEGVPRHGERLLVDPFPEWAPNLKQERQRHFGILHSHYLPPLQESEGVYLQRHRLLAAAERRLAEANPAALDASPFRPDRRFQWPEK
jgi:hypothetical protein